MKSACFFAHSQFYQHPECTTDYYQYDLISGIIVITVVIAVKNVFET